MRDYTGAAVSYLASFLAYLTSRLEYVLDYIGDLNWMQIGAAALLIARLVTDVPQAWEAIQKIRRKRKERREQENGD